GTRMNLDYRVKQESITDIRVGDEFASIASPLDPLGPGASDVVSPLASGHFGSHEATTRQTDHLKRAVGGGVGPDVIQVWHFLPAGSVGEHEILHLGQHRLARRLVGRLAADHDAALEADI